MLTKDLNTVVSALKSQPSELYELNEAGTQIRRKTPLVEQNMTPRTIYAVKYQTIFTLLHIVLIWGNPCTATERVPVG